MDTETTGLEPREGHRIVEIGALELINCIPTGKTFHVYINPERQVPAEAIAIHGLDDDFLRNKPRFADVAQDFLDFIADSPLVIHNAAFDTKFLNAELSAIEKPVLAFERIVDTLALARKKFPGARVSLDALCKRFRIDNTARTLHGALLDSELLAEVYLELTGGAQAALLTEEEKQDQNHERGYSQGLLTKKRPPRDPRTFPVCEKELSEHKAFIATIKNTFWDSKNF